MATFEIDHPVIVTLREELAKRVETYKANFALRDSGGKVTTYSKAITLPLDDEEQDIIDGLSKFIVEHESTDIENERKAIFFSHIARQLQQASEFFKDLAEDWANYIPTAQGGDERLTDAQLKSLSKECYSFFQNIIDWTGDPEASGQSYTARANDKGFLLDIPRIKVSTKSQSNSTTFHLVVDDVEMNPAMQVPYMNHALREAFGTKFKASELIDMLKEQGITFTTKGTKSFALPSGETFQVEFVAK
jgi:hypothetical protein